MPDIRVDKAASYAAGQMVEGDIASLPDTAARVTVMLGEDDKRQPLARLELYKALICLVDDTVSAIFNPQKD
jgi:hypothetical protein